MLRPQWAVVRVFTKARLQAIGREGPPCPALPSFDSGLESPITADLSHLLACKHVNTLARVLRQSFGEIWSYKNGNRLGNFALKHKNEQARKRAKQIAFLLSHVRVESVLACLRSSILAKGA